MEDYQKCAELNNKGDGITSNLSIWTQFNRNKGAKKKDKENLGRSCHVLTGFVSTTLSSSAIPHAGPKVLHLATGETTLQLHQCYSQGYKLAFGILNKAVFIAFFGVRHEAYEIRT